MSRADRILYGALKPPPRAVLQFDPGPKGVSRATRLAGEMAQGRRRQAFQILADNGGLLSVEPLPAEMGSLEVLLDGATTSLLEQMLAPAGLTLDPVDCYREDPECAALQPMMRSRLVGFFSGVDPPEGFDLDEVSRPIASELLRDCTPGPYARWWISRAKRSLSEHLFGTPLDPRQRATLEDAFGLLASDAYRRSDGCRRLFRALQAALLDNLQIDAEQARGVEVFQAQAMVDILPPHSRPSAQLINERVRIAVEITLEQLLQLSSFSGVGEPDGLDELLSSITTTSRQRVLGELESIAVTATRNESSSALWRWLLPPEGREQIEPGWDPGWGPIDNAVKHYFRSSERLSERRRELRRTLLGAYYESLGA